MSIEENVQQELLKQFSYIQDHIRIPRPRRIFLDVPLDKFGEVLDFSRRKLKFIHLCTITGLDEGENLSFIYHLAKEDAKGVVLNIKTSAPKSNPVIKIVTSDYPDADAYERELVDLFGARVEGLAEGHRYPLTDEWPTDQHPLRKDWKPFYDTGSKEAANNA